METIQWHRVPCRFAKSGRWRLVLVVVTALSSLSGVALGQPRLSTGRFLAFQSQDVVFELDRFRRQIEATTDLSWTTAIEAVLRVGYGPPAGAEHSRVFAFAGIRFHHSWESGLSGSAYLGNRLFTIATENDSQMVHASAVGADGLVGGILKYRNWIVVGARLAIDGSDGSMQFGESSFWLAVPFLGPYGRISYDNATAAVAQVEAGWTVGLRAWWPNAGVLDVSTVRRSKLVLTEVPDVIRSGPGDLILSASTSVQLEWLGFQVIEEMLSVSAGNAVRFGGEIGAGLECSYFDLRVRVYNETWVSGRVSYSHARLTNTYYLGGTLSIGTSEFFDGLSHEDRVYVSFNGDEFINRYGLPGAMMIGLDVNFASFE